MMNLRLRRRFAQRSQGWFDIFVQIPHAHLGGVYIQLQLHPPFPPSIPMNGSPLSEGVPSGVTNEPPQPRVLHDEFLVVLHLF
jgi:hypothetical protein